MLVSFLFIMQQAVFSLYKVGIVLLVVTVLLQIPFGNIAGESNFQETLSAFVRYFSILVLVIIVAIIMTPCFVRMGGGV